MQTSKLFKLTAFGVGLIVIGLVVYIFINRQQATEDGANKPLNAGSVAGAKLSETENLRPEQGIVEIVNNNQKKYTHPVRGFSFIYPQGFSLSYLPENDTESILVSEGGGKAQAQIYCQTLAEPVVITPQKIKLDIPSIKMREAKTLLVANTPAVSFIDEETNTREVWFALKSNFCQISSFAVSANIVDGIINTWEWK